MVIFGIWAVILFFGSPFYGVIFGYFRPIKENIKILRRGIKWGIIIGFLVTFFAIVAFGLGALSDIIGNFVIPTILFTLGSKIGTLLFEKRKKPEKTTVPALKVPKLKTLDNQAEPIKIPAGLSIKANPDEISADGMSKSTLRIQLLDKDGNSITAHADSKVKVTTTGGKLERDIIEISKGTRTAEVVLTSSTEGGKIVVTAEADEIERGVQAVEFKEKPRFCMGCGSRLGSKDKKCEKCEAAPQQFTGDAKSCKNCEGVGKKTYNPATAKFCRECGASQPKEG
jgi:hypothetical protein